MIRLQKYLAECGVASRRSAEKLIQEGAVSVNGLVVTELGTKVVWKALGATKAYTVVGGGDSITATTKYDKMDAINYICTGGGALIRFLTGEELPVVKALRFAAAKWEV